MTALERNCMDTLISVIVPVYKVEKYLDRCVESIVAQSYKNIEIILVDDGSPDHCGQICDEWAKKDERIKVIHKPNGGAADARNVGIQKAGGEYITFVDSDDYIAPLMVEKLYDAILNASAKMSMCNTACVDTDGNDTAGTDCQVIPEKNMRAEDVLPLLYLAWGIFYIVPWNKLIHRSLLSDHFFPVNKGTEDEFVAAQLLWSAQTIVGTDYVGYFYVQEREGSAMQSWSNLQRLDSLEALLIRYRFYQDIGQNTLLHETRARVMKALETYYWGEPSSDPAYDARMAWIRQEYDKLTGLPPKEWLKWRLFQISPKLEKWFIQALKAKNHH